MLNLHNLYHVLQLSATFAILSQTQVVIEFLLQRLSDCNHNKPQSSPPTVWLLLYSSPSIHLKQHNYMMKYTVYLGMRGNLQK